MQEAAARLLENGALAQWHGDWGLDDLRDCLRSGCYPIVGVERRYFGHPSAAHAMIIANIRATEIEILDPLQGPAPRSTSLDTFVAAWRNAGQEVLVLATPFAD